MSSRTEEKLRAAERSGDRAALLAARIRAGVGIPWSVGLEEECRYCRGAGATDEGGWTPCPDCHGTGIDPGCHPVVRGELPAELAVRLGAYLGDEAARKVDDTPWALVDSVARNSADSVESPWHAWSAGLLRLCEPAPPMTVGGVECECDNGMLVITGPDPTFERCPDCLGTGTRTVEVPFARWLAVRLAVEVGREVLPAWEASQPTACTTCQFGDEEHAPTDHVNPAVGSALDAAARWCVCPCPARSAACRLALAGLGPVWARASCVLAYDPATDVSATLGAGLVVAAEEIGGDRVRAALRRAGRAVLG